MTSLGVSCPSCGAENTVGMGPEGIPANDFLSRLFPSIKQYSFSGIKKCHCGKLVMAALTVTGDEEETDERD